MMGKMMAMVDLDGWWMQSLMIFPINGEYCLWHDHLKINSAGSQFFICVADAPHLDGQYTVFGEVIDKVHIVDHIVNTPTEYSQAVMMSKESIPDREDPDDWITLKDPKTKKKLYSKIPKNMRKTDYEYDMRNKIKSNKPAIPVFIEKVRVVKNTMVENEAEPAEK